LAIQANAGFGCFVRPLVVCALESFDATIALPKLYVVTVYKLPGVYLGGVVVGADKLDRPEKTTIYANKISAILGHLRQPHRRNFRDYRP
jgi:hypothetical protein